jgi:hypothetical protein
VTKGSKASIDLRRGGDPLPNAVLIARLFGLRQQNRANPIRVIIDATSTADNKTKSRWTRAVCYAWRKRRAWSDLTRFLWENGGHAGCAQQFAAIKKRISRTPSTGTPGLVGLI